MTKLCMNCGKSLEDSVKYCPYCHSQEFRNKNELAVKNNSLVHSLFYNNYDGFYVISKSKVAAISVFLIFSLIVIIPPSSPAVVIFAAIIAAFFYLIFTIMRKIIGKPQTAKITHNDYGLITDLSHLLFFWQNNEGGYALSKTKICSHMIFVAFFITAFSLNVPSVFAAVLFGLFFEAPSFLVGYGIHKLTNPNPEAEIKKIEPKKEAKKPKIEPKVEIPSTNEVIPEYEDYKKQISDLESRFKTKEKAARSLIEKKFEPPQLTYNRFIGGVDKSKELFNKNKESALRMISLADEYSPRIAEEIEEKISIMGEINSKLDALSNELVLNENITSEDDVDSLIDEMDVLIDSVKDYKQK